MITGIFGGTFDPPHIGHVAALKEFINRCGVERVLVIPTGVPPHKNAGMTEDKDRLEMTKIAISGIPVAGVCDYEIKKGGKSYTVDTLEWLCEKLPNDTFVLYTGSDMFLSLHTWFNAETILALCSVAAFSRTGDDRDALERQAEYLREKYGASVAVYEFTPEVISSSEIREMIDTGADFYPFLPAGVAEYIEKNGLYGFDLYGYKKFLRERLSEKRFVHSLGVAKTAKKLAGIYGADEKKAYLAGLLHDITKNLGPSEQIEFCIKHGIEMSADDIESPQVLHAVTGEWYLRKVVGITDEEVLSAARYHTTGRKGITLLEKIIYVADFTEPSRDYSDADYYRELSEKDLDRALFEGMKWIMEDKRKKGEKIHKDTVEMFVEYANKGYR
ncbi:MAG: nicotinate-nucleotide adenylyltransferase [Clostridia bacterium]|nr:nicotinate-nucleotide adenylyltransferase [Clostridia bacterium]